ncbi:MAG: cupin domain-containing protein [bacterium]|nr:cupin domain-containing protein [bacterium]
MAYIFHQDELPKLVSESPGRERIFFVSDELADTKAVLAGIIRYKKGTASPYHYHENCDHFYFLLEGTGTVETEEGPHPVKAGTLVFIPAEEKHRLRASEDSVHFELQAPNQFKTTILEGTDADLRWKKVDGKVWIQS